MCLLESVWRLGTDQKTLETLASPLSCEVEEGRLGHTSQLYLRVQMARRLVNILVPQGVAPVKGVRRGRLPSAQGPASGLPAGQGGHRASVPSPALKGTVPWAAAPAGWAGPRQAQAALGLQSAEAVLVGHPGGHAQPAGG